jgi:hypothetical protein
MGAVTVNARAQKMPHGTIVEPFFLESRLLPFDARALKLLPVGELCLSQYRQAIECPNTSKYSKGQLGSFANVLFGQTRQLRKLHFTYIARSDDVCRIANCEHVVAPPSTE